MSPYDLKTGGARLDNPKIFVAIAGNIGTGKTTLTGLLSKRFGWNAHYEVVADNPYLTDFYLDMKRWSFPLQIFFLNTRFRAHKQISVGSNSSIQDRSIYEDANIFARNLYEQGELQDRDYKNYLDLYGEMCKFLTPPDLIIYLRKSVPNLKKRITERGREYERGIPDSYLNNLNQFYDDWMQHYRLGKKLIINSDDLDFIKNTNDLNMLSSKIIDTIDQRDLFLDSKFTHSA